MESKSQPEPVATPKSKRRWFQYSISTLLLIMVVCAAGLAKVTNRARQQDRTVEFVESLGGQVSYSYDNEARSIHAPAWMRRMLGRDYFETVIEIDLSRTEVSDAELANLKGLTALQGLDLYNTEISDAGLAQLKRLRGLKRLRLENCRVGSVGLGHLSQMADLESLALFNTQVGDDGLEHLQKLTRLEYLDLRCTKVSDAGIAHLKDMSALRYLQFSATHISEERVEELGAALPKCWIVWGDRAFGRFTAFGKVVSD